MAAFVWEANSLHYCGISYHIIAVLGLEIVSTYT